LLGFPACANPSATPDQDPIRAASRQLVQAPPDRWAASLSRVLESRRGEDRVAMANALVAELRADRPGPGAQAAIAALSRLGGQSACAYLRETLADRGDLAVDAALALGFDTTTASRQLLIEVADDRLASATLRAACAASLVRRGEGRHVAELVRGFVLAGSPAGNELLQRLGLPRKSRWAHERYLLQAALLAAAADDFGLDTDASWPSLEATADRVSVWLTTGRPR